MLTIDVCGASVPPGLDEGDAVQEVWAAAGIPEQGGQDSNATSEALATVAIAAARTEQNERKLGEMNGRSTVQPTEPAILTGPPSQRVEDVPEVNRDAQGIREASHPMADELDQSTATAVSIASDSASGEAREANFAEEVAEPVDARSEPFDETSAEGEDASTGPGEEGQIHSVDAASVARSDLATPAAESSPGGRLDVNRDGTLTPLDALLIANYLHASDLATVDLALLDVNWDGWITAADFGAVVAGLNPTNSDDLTVQSTSEGETVWEEYCEQLKANEIATLTHPSVTHLTAESFDQFQRQLRLGPKDDLVRNASGLTTLAIRRPLFGQIQPLVQERMRACERSGSTRFLL